MATSGSHPYSDIRVHWNPKGRSNNFWFDLDQRLTVNRSFLTSSSQSKPKDTP